ncbi:actin-binding protein WASF3 [Engraulis encrasicolus]|uniref:actin-binding protein WASF3 n=1 Tax=Engraulis encrasicolus TaxID=184585 RepID=UPI002FD75F35
MPMLKRSVEPRHVSRTSIPESIGSELECVNNATLSAVIRQLSSLSKHAEDVFAELFAAASVFYWRSVCLQERVERLAIKVTQLDSNVEEVSLQDIHLRKAFQSGVCQEQQVVCKTSMPPTLKHLYCHSDHPPPLAALTPYRDDGLESMRLYSDPCFFFDLWKERMTQATEEKRMERRRLRQDQKRGMHGTLPREVKRVRKVRDRREEWSRMALDKELRPDAPPHTHTPPFPDLLPPQSIPTNHRPSFPEHPPTQPILTNSRPPPPAVANEASGPAQRVEHEYHSIGGEVSIAVVYRSPPG